MKKNTQTFYYYNTSNRKLTTHLILNPNRTLVRNQFGNPDVDFPDDNMRQEFFFDKGVLEANTQEEIDFLMHYVQRKPYKLKNGRMFEPWLAVGYFTTEQEVAENAKPKTITTQVEKIVIPEESAALMSIDRFKDIFNRAGLTYKDGMEKDELIAILKENGNIM